MKKCFLWLLLLSAGFSLFAQVRPGGAVFFQPITGISDKPGDHRFVTQMLTREINKRDDILTRNPLGTNFKLYGTLSHYNKNEFIKKSGRNAQTTHTYNAARGTPWEKQYVFQLMLKDTKTNEILLHQNVIYSSIVDVYSFFPDIVNNLFSKIYSIKNRNRQNRIDWLDRPLYFSWGIFWSPRVYSGKEQDTFLVNFGGTAAVEFHPTKILSFETGLEVTSDWPTTTTDPHDTYWDFVLEIPVSVKFIIRLSDHYMVAPYVGGHINASLFDTTIPTHFSWMAGLQYGVKAGRGIFYIDPRFSMDIGNSSVNEKRGSSNPYEYQRYIIHMGIGYKFGLLSR